MPRIQPIDPAQASAAVAEQLAATQRALGSIPQMFATAAQSPAALTAMNAFFAALGRGRLGGKIGERIAIAVAQEDGCEYCLSAHTALGTLHGVDAGDLAAARRGVSSDPKAQAALRLALTILERRGRVPDAALEAARTAGLDDGDIVEVVAHVGLNVFTNYLNNLAQTEVDFPRVPLGQAA
jgi:AhpD family alkylhydroperoxidase